MAQTDADEYRVKAAFLFHFAQLVDWPEQVAVDDGDSLLICTFGDDPFHGALETTMDGKTIGHRVIRILHIQRSDQLSDCRVLFLGHAQAKRMAALLVNLGNAPVLTVGEDPGFLAAGGMICFLLQQNKVRFDINLLAAENARLKIGSRLLVLAQNVVQTNPGH